MREESLRKLVWLVFGLLSLTVGISMYICIFIPGMLQQGISSLYVIYSLGLIVLGILFLRHAYCMKKRNYKTKRRPRSKK
jgi:hypothetical protein